MEFEIINKSSSDKFLFSLFFKNNLIIFEIKKINEKISFIFNAKTLFSIIAFIFSDN